jgi:ATP-binding cassette, subfamily B, bacterial PglK
MTTQLSLFEAVKRLWALLPVGDGWRLGALLAMMLTASVLEMAGVGAIPLFVAALAQPEPVLMHPWLQPVWSALGVHDARSLLVTAGWLLVGLFLVKNAYIMLYHFLESRYIWGRYQWLASRLFNGYLTAPYVFHRQRNSSALMRNVTEESRFLVHELLAPLLRLCMNVLLVSAVFVLLMVFEPVITLGAGLVLGGSGALFLFLIKQKITAYGLQAHEARLGIIRGVNETLEGIKDIRVLQREGFFKDRVGRDIHRYTRAQTFWMTASHANKPVIETVAVAGVMVIALVLLWQGRPMAEIVPVLALFGVATVRLMPDFKQMVNQVNSLRYFRMSVVPVSEDLQYIDSVLAGRSGSGADPSVAAKRPASVKETLGSGSGADSSVAAKRPASPHRTPPPPASPIQKSVSHIHHSTSPAPEIRIDSLCYTYPDGAHPVLRDVSITIPSGGFVGLAGPSGGGKTTLVDVLLGLLEPNSGQVLIDEMPLGEWLDANPGGVGYIPQTIFLCDDSLRRNIALGIPDELIDETRIQECISAARLDELVAGLPAGLSTVIGERGIRLSGGQRQRIGIARALYSNPSLIVMDEATSALDSETESEVMAAVELLRGTRTVLIIAHRQSTMENCDEVFFLGGK